MLSLSVIEVDIEYLQYYYTVRLLCTTLSNTIFSKNYNNNDQDVLFSNSVVDYSEHRQCELPAKAPRARLHVSVPAPGRAVALRRRNMGLLV